MSSAELPSYGPTGPLWLLSGPLHRKKLLSSVFLRPRKVTVGHAKGISLVCLQLSNVIFAGPLGLLSGALHRTKLLSLSVLLFVPYWE